MAAHRKTLNAGLSVADSEPRMRSSRRSFQSDAGCEQLGDHHGVVRPMQLVLDDGGSGPVGTQLIVAESGVVKKQRSLCSARVASSNVSTLTRAGPIRIPDNAS